MNKWQLAELERVFCHDIDYSTCRTGVPVAPMRRNKAVRELIGSGHLVEVEAVLDAVTVRGLGLTAMGHMAYCESCADEGDSS